MKRLIIYLAACAFSSAMVPRERRALNEEDTLPSETTSSSETPAPPVVCAEDTPCAWDMYTPVSQQVGPKSYFTNNFCVCAKGTTCQITKDAKDIYAYVLHCRPAEVES